MTETYLQHVTLNTGDHLASPRSGVSDKVVSILRPLIERARAGEIVPWPAPNKGYAIYLTPDGDCCAVTLWAPDLTSILTIGIAAGDGAADLWRRLHDWMPGHGITVYKTNPDHPPAVPWCADIIEPGALVHPEALRWTGDMSRCIAWTWVMMRQNAADA